MKIEEMAINDLIEYIGQLQTDLREACNIITEMRLKHSDMIHAVHEYKMKQADERIKQLLGEVA